MSEDSYGKQLILLPNDTVTETNIQSERYLDSGRMARVDLVDVNLLGLSAEKTFQPQEPVRRLYERTIGEWPYGRIDGEIEGVPFSHAARAALHRRVLLHELTKVFHGRPLVANGLYTRSIANEEVLGTEYIEGRGPRIGPVNYHLFRRSGKNPEWEIDEVAESGDYLAKMISDWGFLGTVWQCSPKNPVETANILIQDGQEKRMVLIDTEFGVFAPPFTIGKEVIPGYVRNLVRIGIAPSFDDIDVERLEKTLNDNEQKIVDKLGTDSYESLVFHFDKLRYHLAGWKDSEDCLRSYRYSNDENPELSDGEYTKLMLKYFELTLRGILRVAYDSSVEKLRDLPKALIRGLRNLPRGVENYGRLLFNETYQTELAARYVDEVLTQGRNSGLLSEEDVNRITGLMSDERNMEYLRGFIVHLGLKVLDLPVLGDVGLGAASIISKTPLAFLSPMIVSPLLRTTYTTSRMVRNVGRDLDYSLAFLGGLVPKIGIGAFLAQLFSHDLELSAFLARSLPVNVGRHIPIYGGDRSLTQHRLIKATDILASIGYELYMYGITHQIWV